MGRYRQGGGRLRDITGLRTRCVEDCCDDMTGPCDAFKSCFGVVGATVNRDIEVTIAGVVNLTCTRCANVDGTYIFTAGNLVYSEPAGKCAVSSVLRSELIGSVCGTTVSYLELDILYNPSGNCEIHVSESVSGGIVSAGLLWTTFHNPGVACGMIDDLCNGQTVSIPPVPGVPSTGCDVRGSTCEITLL